MLHLERLNRAAAKSPYPACTGSQSSSQHHEKERFESVENVQEYWLQQSLRTGGVAGSHYSLHTSLVLLLMEDAAYLFP